MQDNKYKATFLIFLPTDIDSLPFYNNIVIVYGDSIGSVFAKEIAEAVFEDFKDLWDKEDFEKIKSYFIFDEFISLFKLEIINNETKTKVEHEAISSQLVNYLLGKIKKEI